MRECRHFFKDAANLKCHCRAWCALLKIYSNVCKYAAEIGEVDLTHAIDDDGKGDRRGDYGSVKRVHEENVVYEV